MAYQAEVPNEHKDLPWVVEEYVRGIGERSRELQGDELVSAY
jgi:hypothetical protein